MPQIKITVEYDGTNYVGWQMQPNGLAVQEVVERNLARILGESVRINSSGRTDSGVHAKGMVACFKTGKTLPMSAYIDGMNSFLPPDIAIVHAEPVADDFNPRFHATGKHYRYSILLAPRRSPLVRLYAWQMKDRLDLDLMQVAADFFVGEHDFASFRANGCVAKTTVRRIDSVKIIREGDFIHINVEGSGFLRNMVRIMVGTLVAIGRGRLPAGHVKKCLQNPGTLAGATAPPQGLCLVKVYY